MALEQGVRLCHGSSLRFFIMCLCKPCTCTCHPCTCAGKVRNLELQVHANVGLLPFYLPPLHTPPLHLYRMMSALWSCGCMRRQRQWGMRPTYMCTMSSCSQPSLSAWHGWTAPLCVSTAGGCVHPALCMPVCAHHELMLPTLPLWLDCPIVWQHGRWVYALAGVDA
eukprot:scaffold106581_cov20-Tisochrysis_lutea.AAC.2